MVQVAEAMLLCFLAARGYVTFDLRCSCAVDLIEPQLTVLLQLAQLWSVLRRLAQPLEGDVDLASNATVANGAGRGPQGARMGSLGTPGDELLSLEAFQLTSNELQNFVALQCIFEGTAVRVFFATATPLMPLALLLACCFLEIFSKGMGHLPLKGWDVVGTCRMLEWLRPRF